MQKKKKVLYTITTKFDKKTILLTKTTLSVNDEIKKSLQNIAIIIKQIYNVNDIIFYYQYNYYIKKI